MKKFLLSATLLVAFSLTSFAAEKEFIIVLNASIESDIALTKKVDDGCETFVYRWAEGESDGEVGMILTFHSIKFEICSDIIIII
ncbi:hypothetical protein [Flavobacterium caseinilyticum]|uniref:Uncharacterized protein n=1 Tax=Flavobacterium caseinilyticum TaxID=2541732 RepID=A0A4V2YUQ0_9FLAO|nr:hypothetical protein [Flavobacterium caseinilyticum]TDD78527.1 hypothetical protein E0F89_02520 [Flavobacterium caseinilyticum]